MNYKELLEILQENDINTILRNHEKEIFSLIPELKTCKGFNQNNDYHIYDIYEHTLHVLENTGTNYCLRIAGLFHDIGKPITYKEDENGVGHFPYHWFESLKIFDIYKDKFNLSFDDYKLINNLIYFHDITIDKMDDEELNEMIYYIGIDNIDLLFELKRADLLAQNPKYYYLLDTINKQEEKVKKYINNHQIRIRNIDDIYEF